MKVSVIVRTHNEDKTIGRLLETLNNQTYDEFELIIVDNDSTDKTLDIVKKYKVDKLIHIPNGKFSHPKSLNDAIKIASGDLIVITNGHSIPFTKTWIEDGIKNFKDPKVAGVNGWYTDKEKIGLKHKIRLTRGANLSNTNAIIRKDLWKLYHFDENLSGVEDYDWGLEMKSRGYKIIKDPAFNVMHFHIIDEERKSYWQEMKKIIEDKKRPSL
jgi:rhamnosyltransferase